MYFKKNDMVFYGAIITLFLVTAFNVRYQFQDPTRVYKYSCSSSISDCLENTRTDAGVGFYSVMKRFYQGYDLHAPAMDWISANHLSELSNITLSIDKNYESDLTLSVIDTIGKKEFVKIDYFPRTYIPLYLIGENIGKEREVFIWKNTNLPLNETEEKQLYLFRVDDSLYILPVSVVNNIRSIKNLNKQV